MKSLIIIFILAFVSCSVPGSLHPLSNNITQVHYNQELVGKWQSSDSPDEIYVIEPGDDPAEKYYHCTIYSKNKDTAYFLVRLIQLNGINYLDSWFNLEKISKEDNDLAHYNVPRHFFYKMNNLNKNSVELSSPDLNAIRGLVKNGKINLQIAELHSMNISDDYLVISETPELQKAFKDLEKYASTVYKEKSTFTRIQ